MITSRPQTRNIISFVLFLFIAYTLIIVNVLSITRDVHPIWANYVVASVLTPIALFITYKVLFRYKIIILGNGKVEVRYPQFGRRKTFALHEISFWRETVIKTGKTSTYRELEIMFTGGTRINMAFREYTEYDKMIKYLTQKVPKLKKAAS